MPIYGPIYNITNWRIITSYFFSMAKYGMCRNATSQKKYAEHMYIDGRPKIHGNITGYINNFEGIGSPTNYDFVEYSNDKYDFMPRKMKHFVGVAPIVTLNHGDEILVHYNINKHIPARKRCMDS